jgi:excisionase family DNA binding protein
MDTTDFQHRIFSASEAADHLRISRSFLYKMIAADKLRPVKLGTRTVFTGRELLRFIEAASKAA